jgi:predicted nuclease of predicted toxin-antitoxin system
VLPLLLDEGLPPAVAHALYTLGLVVWAVGDPGAPVRKSSDEVNCAWCAENNAVLVTNDRGKKDRTIFDHLAQQHVHAIFVHKDLRDGPEHLLAKALLIAEPKMELWAAKHLLRHRLQPGGGLKKRP